MRFNVSNSGCASFRTTEGAYLKRIQHCYWGEGGAAQERVTIVLLLGAFVTLASKILPVVGAHQKNEGLSYHRLAIAPIQNFPIDLFKLSRQKYSPR